MAHKNWTLVKFPFVFISIYRNVQAFSILFTKGNAIGVISYYFDMCQKIPDFLGRDLIQDKLSKTSCELFWIWVNFEVSQIQILICIESNLDMDTEAWRNFNKGYYTRSCKMVKVWALS